MPVVQLNQNFINNNLECPEGKMRIEYCDTDLPGLYVLVGNTCKVTTYFLRYKDATGKTCHHKIGRTTDIDLVEARRQAKQLRASIALGADPRGEQKAKKESLTFTEFFENHYLPYVKPRKRSWKRDEELYRLHLKPVFGDKRLTEVSRQQWQRLPSQLLEEKG